MIRESLTYQIFDTLRGVYLASFTLGLLNELVSSLKKGFLNSGVLRVLDLPVPRRKRGCSRLTKAVGDHYAQSLLVKILGGLEKGLEESYTRSLFYRYLVEGERVNEEKPL
jgi:hypothetical protein